MRRVYTKVKPYFYTRFRIKFVGIGYPRSRVIRLTLINRGWKTNSLPAEQYMRKREFSRTVFYKRGTRNDEL